MLARPAWQQDDAPAPAPAPAASSDFLSVFTPRQQFTPLPAPYQPPAPQQQAPAPAQQQQQQQPLSFMPHPYTVQANQVAERTNPYSRHTAKKYEDERKAEDARSAYFGGEGEYVPEEMSVDAYLTLSPQQRASVDANTALVQAAEQDIASWAKQQVAGKAVDDKNYFEQVNKTFGEKGGSDTYAPRTLAVLGDLGLNLEGKDLDQYLNYSALVTADDLKALSPGAPVAAEDPRQQNAVAFAEAATTRLSETLAAGQTLLDSLRTSSDTGRQLFGEPTTMAPVGYANTERDADLKQAFDIFAQARSQQDLTPETVGSVYAELQTKHGVTPNEVAQYFETRLQSNEYLNAAEDSDVTLGGPTSSHEYLSPQDFRSKYLKAGA